MTKGAVSRFNTLSAKLGIVPCKISRSGFSSERVFEIVGEDSSIKGVCNKQYCLDAYRDLISDDVPPVGVSIDGFVVVRVLSEEAGVVTISLPSGDVIMISGGGVAEIE